MVSISLLLVPSSSFYFDARFMFCLIISKERERKRENTQWRRCVRTLLLSGRRRNGVRKESSELRNSAAVERNTDSMEEMIGQTTAGTGIVVDTAKQ